MSAPRTTALFNTGWRFAETDDPAATGVDFDDASWRGVTLPHDWSVEHPFDESLEGCTGYLPGGFGTYRKTFTTPATVDGGRMIVSFDGVYNRSAVWVNGKKIHEHPYGYSPFDLDLTDHLNPTGRDNLIAVRVDRTRYADSRWYTGSGIYRDVTLTTVAPLRVAPDGVFVTTPDLTDGGAKVHVRTEVADAASETDFVLHQSVTASDGEEVARTRAEFKSAGRGVAVLEQTLDVADPQHWSPETPVLYRLRTVIERAGEPIDAVESSFGFRTLRFDPEAGFFLNGQPTKIKGVCLHHDGGCVGAAVPDAVWERRLKTLKDGGCNAIRTAHNPPSAAFLGLCDRLGFLVQDEFFDEWDNPKDKRKNCNEKSVDAITRGYVEHFATHAEADLKATMRRDRNHPCVIQWSIGNEIEWTYPGYAESTGFFNIDWQGNYFWSPPPNDRDTIKKVIAEAGHDQCGATAQRLAAWTRELDTTRPVTANCILPAASLETPYGEALDVVGFSYRRVMYDYARRHHPEKTVMGCENLGHYHEWKAVEERASISGLFLWTGVDYLGESGGAWPKKATDSGLLDTAGFPKPSWHHYKTLWAPDVPHAHLTTQVLEKSLYDVDSDGNVVEKEPGQWENRVWAWHDVNHHWNYAAGETVIVEVASAVPTLELKLNGASLGERHLKDFPDRLYKWAVPWEAGELTCEGGGAVDTLHTAGDATQVHITCDRTTLAADGRDAAHVEARLYDADGHRVRHADAEVRVEIDGPARLLGVDNGAATNVQPYQHDRLVTAEGRALAVVQSARDSGTIAVRASGPGLKPSESLHITSDGTSRC